MAKLSTFVETWDTPKSSRWSPWDNDPEKYVANGVLNLKATTGYVGIGTVAQDLDFTESSLTFRVPQLPTVRGAQLGVYVEVPASRNVGFTIEFDTLVCWIGDGSDQSQPFPSGTKWFRVRESGGSVYHETSPDGTTWTVRRTSTTPSGATAAGIGMFCGSFTTDQGFVTVDDVNVPTGVAGSAGFTASGSLAASAKPTVGGLASPSAEGSLDVQASLVSTSGSAGLSAVGTLQAVGTFGYAVSVAQDAAGTLVATGRPAVSGPLNLGATVGTLEAVGVAKILAEAAVRLGTVWLNDSGDLSNYRAFPTLSGLTVTQTREGEVRRYATGRLRSVTKAGSRAKVDLTLQDLAREDVLWLESLRGTPVAVRDDRGRKTYAVFYEVPVVERRFSARADVNLSLVEVTRTEAV